MHEEQGNSNVIINSILQIDVPSFEDKIINGKNETIYYIILKNLYNKSKWKLEKTYQDFIILNEALTKLLPNTPSFCKNKGLFKSSKDYNIIVKRKIEIYEYLCECVSRKDILSNKSFIIFIELEKNFPELIYNSPDFIEKIKNDMTLTEMQYLEKENIIFSIFSDLEIASRMDSYMKSGEFLNFKKEEISPQEMSKNELGDEEAKKNKVGAFCTYKLIVYKNKKNELKIKLEKIFVKYFNEITGSLFYDTKKNYFIIGLMSGRILFYKIAPDSGFTQFDFIEELKYHSGKVTGVAFNQDNNAFFSCDDVGNFYFGIIDMIHKKNYCPRLINESSKGYTKLYYEKENERLYLSTVNGHLEVYLTSTSPLFVNEIITNTSENFALNDLIPYTIKHYLFSCSDKGNISVFDLGKPGQEKTTKELSFFNYYRAKFQIKTIIYEPDTNQVITGDDQGRIIFWSLKYGKPIHVTRVSKKKKCVMKIRFVENSEEKNKLLFVSCLDNSIYFIKLPLKWLNNDEIEQYELIEIKSRSDLDAMMKIQDLLEKNEDYNSDEDSLNGWDYFANDVVEERNKKI